MDRAAGGRVQEGSVGGGTGMICHEFKGGIGTASRRLSKRDGGYTVGVLVQCNYGRRSRLSVLGAPVGAEISDLRPCSVLPADATQTEQFPACPAGAGPGRDSGSIIVIVATDAPLLPHQLQRVVKRVAVGLARQGGFGGNGSGDIFLAFSTANAGTATATDSTTVKMISNAIISPLFHATAWATEAAITNALLAAETMQGANDLRVYGMPHDRMLQAMRKYGRLAP
jgi:L-aminopeptidase/D-esterase-like protein